MQSTPIQRAACGPHERARCLWTLKPVFDASTIGALTLGGLVFSVASSFAACGPSPGDQEGPAKGTDDDRLASPPVQLQGSGESPVSTVPTVGTVVSVRLPDTEQSARAQDRLHFCVFENGKNDLIYVGTKYGMWSSGEFDLSIGGPSASDVVVYTGHIEHLVYEGVLLNMGDVLEEQPESNTGIHVTRIAGMFK